MSVASIVRPPSLWVPSPVGGSSPYVAKAVHFDGVNLNRGALTATNNHLYSVVGWQKMSSANLVFNNLFTVDPNGSYAPAVEPEPDINNPHEHYAIALFLQGTNSPDHASLTSTHSFPVDTWVLVIISIDNSLPSGGKVYYGDMDVTGTLGWDTGGTVPFNISNNSLQFVFGDDSFGNFFTGDLADWRIMPGVSLLNEGGDIPEATRRLFIDADGKPVDPTIATVALGAIGAVLFSGDSTTFPVNQGTGGAFTLTGSLTNASTSPSD